MYGFGACRSSKGHTVTHVACNAAGTLAACAAGRTLHVFEVTAEDYEVNRWAQAWPHSWLAG